jgi:hypothetical protein
MTHRRATWLIKLSLLALTWPGLSTLNASCENSSPPPLPNPAVLPVTNRYHLSFAWDAVTNATSYQVIVRYSGVETQRISTATNWIVVSNLTADLDNYRFSCVATNDAGVSDESERAPLHHITILESSVSPAGPWSLLTTNSFWSLDPNHWIGLSNWSAATLLKKD